MKRMMQLAAALALAMASSAAPAAAEWVKHPAAVQKVYQQGAPHTDRQGKPLSAYDPKLSFLPRGLYHALHGETRGVRYDFADYAAAGFNACHLWEQQDPTQLADAASAAGVQLIVHGPSDEHVTALHKHPAILAWYLDEEPTGAYWGKDMEARFAAFVARREQIRGIDPQRPVFALDVAWIMPPATEWWLKWNTAGDITCHDNYPVNQHRQTLSFENGICETVSLAVSAVEQKKPMWLCTQAFEAQDQRFPVMMPSPRQLRCMSYTALVHGATGLIHFALDSWVTRSGSVVGMAPKPQASYGQDLVATADQLRMSRDLWDGAAALNAELAELEPALLSPTAAMEYEVSLDDVWHAISAEPIRTLLKHHPDGGYVLLVVNVDAAPLRARVELAEAPRSAELMFDEPGASGFSAAEKAIELKLGPYGVAVIRLDR